MTPTHTPSQSPEHAMQETKRKPALSPAESPFLHNILVTTPEGTSTSTAADHYTFH